MPVRRFPFGQAPRAVTARQTQDVTAPLPAVAPTRRLPARHETPPPRIESPPTPERLTMPLDEGAPRRLALPFVARPDQSSRARRWLRLTFIVVGLLLYAGILLGIVAPDAWWR